MSLTHFSALSMAPALANHLWQSTLFAVAAGLLTLAFRRNQAQVRYWIWQAASLKFLIPFAPLVAIGSHWAWFGSGAETQSGFYLTVEQIGRPFTPPIISGISPAASPVHALAGGLLSILLGSVWLCGFLAVLAIWCVRWRRISVAIRQSIPLPDGREVKALRCLERAAGMPWQLEILATRTTLEPGIFGVLRPVLLWPEGISERLTQSQLEAILAHELCHVRRRDNLAAALHMIIEALFWFHPLVWWMGAHLIDERERACDEQVLQSGSQREVYAESILKVCEFCVGSPLACVSGVTGSDLKRRMVHIMSEHVIRKLDFSRKLLITTAAVLAIAIPIVFGVLNATPSRAQSSDQAAGPTVPAFQSFSIKATGESMPTPNPGMGNNLAFAGNGGHVVQMMMAPDGFMANNVTMATLIQEAYGVQANQIAGGPDWLKTATFDVQAKVDKSETPNIGAAPNKAVTNRMLQAALVDSTKLAVHTETKNLPTYTLVVAENGAKLQADPVADSAEGLSGSDGPRAVGMRRMGIKMELGGQDLFLAAQGVSVSDFAGQLSRQLGTVVVDKTGLKGRYDFNLHFTANANASSNANDASENNASDNGSSASLFTAIQQQLGLKLVPQTQPMPVVVIDHIEKPVEN